MKRYVIILSLIFLCSVFPNMRNGWAGSTYEADIVLPAIIENSLNKNKKLDGYHGKVVQQILHEINGKLSIQIMAPAHAYKAFHDKRFACITPDTKHYYEKDAAFIDSDALSFTKWVIVQPVGSKIIFSKKDLKGMRVGSFYAPDEISQIVPQQDVVYDVKADIRVNLLKVAMKRNDVAVLPYFGVDEMISQHEEFSSLTTHASPPLATAYEGIMCHDNKRGHEIVEQVNKALQTLNIQVE